MTKLINLNLSGKHLCQSIATVSYYHFKQPLGDCLIDMILQSNTDNGWFTKDTLLIRSNRKQNAVHKNLNRPEKGKMLLQLTKQKNKRFRFENSEMQAMCASKPFR